MKNLKNKISSLAKKYFQEAIEIRRHLHAHPELSYEEYETAEFIKEKLSSWAIPHKTMAKTGVIGLIEGRNPSSRIIALRADIDALPIMEENEIEYKSTKPGVMHACGHDVHTTCLLIAAKILNELKSEWDGTVKLIFQPGEEKNPGGASLLIKEGVLKNPAPSCIVGMHVHPQMAVGNISFRAGQNMASADEIYITVKSDGGHAAAPHFTTDTILVASHIVVGLQQVISRNNDPFSPSVLSVSAINGGFTTNVIPKEVKMMGTFRAMDETWRFKAHELIKKITLGIAESMGAKAEINIDVGYPSVFNHEELNAIAVELAGKYHDPEKILETERRMGAEDFGYYSKEIPGCFFRLGTRNENSGITAGVHTPVFNIDETAIETGIGMMAFFGAVLNFREN